MGRITRYLLFAGLLALLRLASGDIYQVKISTEQHVNTVDSRFLSFTVDPQYLFSNNEKYNSKESICMASSLAPAYIRIAGPSTKHMTFHNSTITFTDLGSNRQSNHSTNSKELAVTHTQWRKFVHWAKATGFDLVFALNHEEKTAKGLWDPNTALDILTVAEKANIGDIFWQLGYECRNQSIDDYLNDLETMRVIMETFPEGQRWRLVGGDITKCLQYDSKSDFRDYVTLSDEMLDAVLLNGNSSAQELDRMTEISRLKLLKRLSTSTTPLWLTETIEDNTQDLAEVRRAADWMTSLGYSARNGFAVHFREMAEKELYEPTLSFYMALLYKNLVGERVLNVDMEAAQAVLFAHCTSLRHKQVPGAVTLFGANLDDEPARFSVKLSRREEGGDIMQFILGHDISGNIVVNGRPMYYEGDIRPVVKRVRPYKSLLINLPSKSFGFWVLANTNIEACHDAHNDTEIQYVEATTTVENEKKYAGKHKDIGSDESEKPNKDNDVVNDSVENNERLKKRVDNLNDDLKNVHILLETLRQRKKEIALNRRKRDVFDQVNKRRIQRRQGLKYKHEKSKVSGEETKPKFHFIKKVLGLDIKPNATRHLKHVQSMVRNKLNKGNYKTPKVKSSAYLEVDDNEKLNRMRRSISKEKHDTSSDKLNDDNSMENEIDMDSKNQIKLWKILHKIHEQLKDLPDDDNMHNDDEYIDDGSESKDEEQIVVKTKMSGDRTSINYSERSKSGLLKSAVRNVVSVLGDLNTNLNNFWKTLTTLD